MACGHCGEPFSAHSTTSNRKDRTGALKISKAKAENSSRISNGKNVSYPKKSLCILHINIQCLGSKLLEMEVLLREHKFNIICINEHWLKFDEISI